MDAKSRVRAGALLLDRLMPDWHKKIDCDRLHVGSVWWCILGQLYKNDDDVSGYDRAWCNLADYYTSKPAKNPSYVQPFMIRNGFSPTGYEFANHLTHFWYSEVMNRRAR